jgi:hypothetical protein
LKQRAKLKYEYFHLEQVRSKRKAGVPEWLKNEKKS